MSRVRRSPPLDRRRVQGRVIRANPVSSGHVAARTDANSILDLTPDAARERLSTWVGGSQAARDSAPSRSTGGSGCSRSARWSEATELPGGAPRGAGGGVSAPAPRAEVDPELSQDGTRKFLWRLDDGEAIESVLIPSGSRRTLCISSQAGCALGCVFCATGLMGFRRNLSPFEIAAQVREVMLRDPADKPSNIVFMGMGEPLLNWPGGGRGAHDPEQSRRARHRRAAHHGEHGGDHPGHEEAGGAAGAVPAGHLAARPDGGAPARHHADREEVRPQGGARGGGGVPEADHLRVRDDRRKERLRPGRRRARARWPTSTARW